MPFPEYLLGVWHCPRCGKRRKDERCGHAFHSLVGGRAGNEWQYSGASTAMGKEALSLTVEGTSRRGSWRKRCRMWGAGVRGAEWDGCRRLVLDWRWTRLGRTNCRWRLRGPHLDGDPCTPARHGVGSQLTMVGPTKVGLPADLRLLWSHWPLISLFHST